MCTAFKACLSSYRDEVAFKHFAEHGYMPLEDEDAPVKEEDSAKPGGSAYLSASDVGGAASCCGGATPVWRRW